MRRELTQNLEKLEELQLEIIRDIESLIALTGEWEALEKKQLLQVPFTTARWNILWWQHLRARKMLIHDELHAFVFRNREQELVAIAPMMISTRPGIGTFGIRVLQFFGADPNITEIRGFVCDPHYTNNAMAAIQRHLLENKKQWDWAEWPGLSEMQAAQLSSSGTPPSKPRPVYYLPLPSSWNELKAGLSRNMKEAIRKCFNSLKRANVKHELRVVSAPDDVADAMTHFFRLHTLRAELADRVKHANVFTDEKSRAFLSAYALDMAQRNCLRIFQIVVDNQVIATRLGFVCDRQLYLYYSGYDIAWSQYSIMTTVVVHAVQWAIENGFECVNLSTGQDYSKLRWHPQEQWHHNAIQLSPRRRSTYLFHTYTYLRSYAITRSLSRS